MKRFTQDIKVGIMAVLMAMGFLCPQQVSAAEKDANVWCVKTNTGNYYPVLNVSMMVVPDDGKTFEIVLKYGTGETGVTDVTFEKHKEKIDFDLYKPQSGGAVTPNFNQYIYMITNTGKYFQFKTVPTLQPVAGSDKFDVVYSDVTEKNVSKVHFVRTGDIDNYMTGVEAPIMDQEENLTLQTPINSQMQISGCGDAKTAVVYSVSGAKVAQSKVSAGMTTLHVSDLTPGVYVVKVGKKSLKFVKK